MIKSLLPLALLVALATDAKAAETVDLLIRDTTVVNVLDGSLRAHQAIAVRGDRIAAIVDDADAGRFDAGKTIPASGTFAIPGLWDMHVHFGGGEALVEENENLLPLYVAHGVTGVRDCAGDLSQSVFAWRAGTAAGTLIGPTIFTSGPKIEGYKSIWPGDQEVGTQQEVEQALDRLQGWHADFVKITDNTLSPQLFLATVKAAEKRGMKTSAHIPDALTLDEVADAGLDSIEHIDYALKAGSPEEKSIGEAAERKEITSAEAWKRWNDSFDPARAREIYARLAKHGMAITPTLNGSQAIAYLDQNDHRHDDYLKYIGPGLQATYAWRIERAAKADAAAIEQRHESFERDASLLPLLQQSGMTILAGTDAGFLNSFDYPGIGLHDELGLLVRYGLTPLQALQAATINGARFLGHDDRYGTLAAGKSADVVLLQANPLEDIAATRKIEDVVLKGKAYDRGQLDAMLADVQARVAAEKAALDTARNPPKNTP